MLTYKVKGDSGAVHAVTALRTGDNVTVTCTCNDAAAGRFCAHRFAVLCGDASALAEEGPNDLSELSELVMGTDVAIALAELRDLQKQADEMAARMETIKRALARAMAD